MKKNSLIILIVLCFNLNAQITKWDKPLYYTNPDYENTLQMVYLGAEGFVMRLGENALMTAPFFSNFSIMELARSVSPKKDIIDRIYPNIPDGLVKAILVGHSHYDHLIDVPYIWNTYQPNTPIYGSETTKNLLLSVKDDKIPEEYIHVLDDEVDIYQYQLGKIIDIVPNIISIMPIESSHSSHLFGYKLFKGKLTEPLKSPPKYAKDWVEGDTFAYLIKFKNGEKDYTIYFQDAASSPPAGLFNNFENTPVDLAILCVGGFSEAENYPEYILDALKPKKIILGHWEDFMASQFSTLDEINDSKKLTASAVEQFIKRIDNYNKKNGTNIEYIVPMLWKNYNFKLNDNSKIQ